MWNDVDTQAIVDTVRHEINARTGDDAVGRGYLHRGVRNFTGFMPGESIKERGLREVTKVLSVHPKAKYNRFLKRWYVPNKDGSSQYLNFGVSQALQSLLDSYNVPPELRSVMVG